MRGNPTLLGAAKNWPTPRCEDAESCGNHPDSGGDSLGAVARGLDVPKGGRGVRHGSSETGVMPDGTKRQVGLENQARRLWATPDANAMQAQMWATPTAGDTKGSDLTTREGGHSLPHQVRETDGGKLSNSVYLNPPFVEWLMGFPIGWTDFGALGTAWSDWSRRMHSSLLRLGWE